MLMSFTAKKIQQVKTLVCSYLKTKTFLMYY